MNRIFTSIYRHFTTCPAAGVLELLCLYSLYIATRIAVLQQSGISNTLYILLLAAIGLAATLALAIHSSCCIRSHRDSRDTRDR